MVATTLMATEVTTVPQHHQLQVLQHNQLAQPTQQPQQQGKVSNLQDNLPGQDCHFWKCNQNVL